MILPYIEKTRQEMKLRSDYPALVIFDVFRGQTVDEVYELLEQNHMYVVKVPSNCTDRLQPLDLSVNKPTKDHETKVSFLVCPESKGRAWSW